MKAYDLVELAGRNLREAVLRNSLTTLGIGVGVASLVAMLSLGVGLQRLVSRQLGRSGLFDSVIVTSRQDFRGERQARTPEKSGEIKILDDTARRNFQQLPDVAEVYPDVRAVSELRFTAPGKQEETHFAVVAGLPMSGRKSDVFDELQGSFFSSGNAPEAIILSDFARDLLDLPTNVAQSDQKLTSEQAGQLLNKQMVLRYAERQANSGQTAG